MSQRSYWKRESYAQDETIGNARWIKSCNAEDAEWFDVDVMCYGDYGGAGVVGKANIETLREDFGDLEDVAWFEVRGSYGSVSIRFDIRVESSEDPWRSDEIKALAEMLDGLEDYCIADEDKLSEVEMTEEEEAWDNFGADDFARALSKLAPHHDKSFFLALGNGTLLSIWHAIADKKHGGEAVIHETGGCYFPISKSFDVNGHACYNIKTWREALGFIRDHLVDVAPFRKARNTLSHR